MLIALCSLLLSVHAGTLRAQDESERAGALTGHVLDAATERPIVGALVEVVGTESTASTDESGRFVLREIPVGVFSVRIRAIGYEPYLYSNVVIGTGKPTTVQLKLVAAPVEVDPLNVTASYFGRTANEASTSTAILGSEAIRRAPGVQEDVIRAVALLPGIGVTTGGRNDLTVRGGAPYENLFIVDGLEVPNLNHFGVRRRGRCFRWRLRAPLRRSLCFRHQHHAQGRERRSAVWHSKSLGNRLRPYRRGTGRRRIVPARCQAELPRPSLPGGQLQLRPRVLGLPAEDDAADLGP